MVCNTQCLLQDPETVWNAEVSQVRAYSEVTSYITTEVGHRRCLDFPRSVTFDCRLMRRHLSFVSDAARRSTDEVKRALLSMAPMTARDDSGT
jgi:hypothetical protein